MTTLKPALFLQTLASMAAARAVFEEVGVHAGLTGQELRCKAKAVDAWYSIVPQGDRWWVRMATPDRWLSESIESDLMHFGDPIEELIEEELVELGHDAGPVPTVKHFRSEDKLYTFENPIPFAAGIDEAAAVETALRYLLAYEAAFRQLGDMTGESGESDE